MEDAVIKITDSHTADGEKSVCELTVIGKYSAENGVYMISYDETDEELKGCSTVLKIDDTNIISMFRTGKYNTEMMFEKERRHRCCYSAPFGDIVMGIYTRNLSSVLDENGGTVELNYTIDFNNDLVSENELLISVTVR